MAEEQKKVSALLSAGEEDVSSYSEAADRLRSWERGCRYRGQLILESPPESKEASENRQEIYKDHIGLETFRQRESRKS